MRVRVATAEAQDLEESTGAAQYICFFKTSDSVGRGDGSQWLCSGSVGQA